MMSLRNHLLLWSLISGPLVVASLGAAAYVVVRDRLAKQFDDALRTQLNALAVTVEQDGDRLDLQFNQLELLLLQPTDRSEDATFIHIWSGGEEVKSLYRSGSLQDTALPPPDGDDDRAIAPRWCTLPGGRGRVVGIRYLPAVAHEEEFHETPKESFDRPFTRTEHNERKEHKKRREHPDVSSPWAGRSNEIVLMVAQRTDEVDDTLADLGRMLIIAGLLAVGVSFAGSIVGVRRGLMSLTRVSETIEQIHPSDLTVRVPEHVPSELAPMVNQINTLLAQMDEAFAREREFSCDVAHELRTPLAGLRMKLDVALLAGDDPAKLRKGVTDCQQITADLEQVVEDLLAIARMDTHKAHPYHPRVNLAKECESVWRFLREEAEQKAVDVSWQVADHLEIATDPSLLRVIVRNLLDNAAEYVDHAGRMTVTASRRDDMLSIEITNTGCTLLSEDASQVTARFWRGSDARENTGRHAGLGLSLVDSAANALGGTLAIHLRPGGVFVAQTVLPAS